MDFASRVPNEAVNWSRFDAHEYWRINYSSVFPEDAEIIQHASKFLAEACEDDRAPRDAVDVGAGSNLYPALLMLPWIRNIVFTEFASSNIGWLEQNLSDTTGQWPWQPFWELLATQPGYRDIADPRQVLADAHTVRTLSIFDLPSRAWNLGSMYFVADGMTTDPGEFDAAVRAFIGSLRPGSPFMAAFMEGSIGYNVQGIEFPAVKVNPASLESLLNQLPVVNTSILRTDRTVRPLRPGYDAMLLVTGFTT